MKTIRLTFVYLALIALRLLSICCLTTTLGLTSIHCLSTAFRWTPIRCVLVALKLLSIRCLAITIRLTSIRCLSTTLGWALVHYELVVLELLFVRCIATTLGLTTVYCLSIALRWVLVRYVLAALRLLSAHYLTTTLKLMFIYCVCVDLCWRECRTLVPEWLPMFWAPIAIRLNVRSLHLYSLQIFVCLLVLTTISVLPVHFEVGARLLLVIPSSMSADIELFPRWISQLYDDLSCNKAGKYEPHASRDSTVITLLTMRCVPWETHSWTGCSLLVAWWCVLAISHEVWLRTFE